MYFSLFGILREIFKSFSSSLKENSISCKKKPEFNKLRSSVPMNDNSFTARKFMSSTIIESRAVSRNSNFGIRLQLQVSNIFGTGSNLKVFGSSSRTIGSIKNQKPLYVQLACSKTMPVEQELKFQAPTPAPPFKICWFRLQPSKIAWAPAPAPQPWLKESIYCG